jgi:hypothetical protein
MVEGRIPRFWSDECGRSRFGECRRIGWIRVFLRAVGLWDIKGFVGSDGESGFWMPRQSEEVVDCEGRRFL